ncbi:MAG: 50S ribosomal protein L10 [Nanoarchaeota archaeon]|nr:50S ribosomal protein L10 [Nanoarchaeota archaeon]
MKQQKTHVSKKKIESVRELSRLLEKNRTTLIASIKNIPASQFQEISKKLRGKAVIKVPKKNLTLRVFNSSKDEDIKKLDEKVDDSVAIIFSELDPFDLALELMQNLSSVKAKAGQVATEDLAVPAGPTDLVPGPAISELGELGIPIMIDKGKISIKESKVVAKKNEKISRGAAEILGKLDIKPFRVGFIPLSAFDSRDKKLYAEIKIDKEGTLADLKQKAGKALAFALKIGYTSEDTIKILLSKAAAEAKKINRIITGESEEAPVVQPAEEEKVKEDKEEKVEATAGLASLFG